ncbi:hypothetical protein FRB90_006083 [Tulasnella sp. 427]|nr:hypothetical protein FRB90_006083 [Tulasnella sp. 427]
MSDNSTQAALPNGPGDFSFTLTFTNHLDKNLNLISFEATSGSWAGNPPRVISPGQTVTMKIDDGTVVGSEGTVVYGAYLGHNVSVTIATLMACQVIGPNKLDPSVNLPQAVDVSTSLGTGHPGAGQVDVYWKPAPPA